MPLNETSWPTPGCAALLRKEPTVLNESSGRKFTGRVSGQGTERKRLGAGGVPITLQRPLWAHFCALHERPEVAELGLIVDGPSSTQLGKSSLSEAAVQQQRFKLGKL